MMKIHLPESPRAAATPPEKTKTKSVIDKIQKLVSSEGRFKNLREALKNCDPPCGGGTMSLTWPGNALGFPRRSWPKWLGRGKSGPLALGCCPRNPTPDKRMKMDGWMDGWMHYSCLI
ncbi:uncharacterized protein [Nothobranchius furzeri]|uniref:uncharacterized protein isoform X2 n=1 Tax=Nothobranchius furzeri TaxID=105023 RepID=UPI003904CFF2